MDINSWIVLDTLIILLNIFYVGYKVFIAKNELQFLARLGIFIMLVFFVFPTGLMPVGIVPRIDILEIPRNWFWHFKFEKLAVGDLSLLLLSVFCFVDVFWRGRDNKFLLVSCLFVMVIFSAGILSAFLAAGNVDYMNLLNASRSFLIVLLLLYAGYRSVDNYGEKSIELISGCLWVTFTLSIISMSLLDTSYRAIRYFVPAMIQSQQFVSAVPFLLLYFWVKRHESSVSYRQYRLWGIAAIMMLFMGYKAFYFLLILFALIQVVSKFPLKMGKWGGGVLLFFVLLLQPLFLFLNFKFGGFEAVDTRAFQAINAMATLQERGLGALLFGIGWGQWYTVYFDFPTIDYGAWSELQLLNDSAKYSIEVLPFSLIRSVGLAGFVSVFIVSILYIFKIGRTTMRNTNYRLIIYGMVLTNITTFFSLPDVLPETAAFSAFFVGAMIASRITVHRDRTVLKNAGYSV